MKKDKKVCMNNQDFNLSLNKISQFNSKNKKEWMIEP